MLKRKHFVAMELIKLYTEGSDLEDWQSHLLHDCAAEHGQILDNVVNTSWFIRALAENVAALDGTGGELDTFMRTPARMREELDDYDDCSGDYDDCSGDYND